MPSIPQSLLWISLVVLWLFVLVPMLINKRDTVRRTSDIALATRVLNGRAKSRLIRRSGPAAGHRHDPDWQRDEVEFEAEFDDSEAETGPIRTVTVMAAVIEEGAEPEYLDVDVVDEASGALPVGAGAEGVQASLFDSTPAEEENLDVDPQAEPEQVADDEYEYIDDTSDLEAEDEPAPAPRRSRRLESSATAAAVSARKYRFRKRVITAMASIMALTAVLAFTVNSGLWWACGITAGVTVLYLGYLRRQTRIEEQVRRRRQQRTARGRDREYATASRMDRDVDAASSRLHRSGAALLDIDDEDPAFEHLDEVRYSRRFDHLPRAAGQ